MSIKNMNIYKKNPLIYLASPYSHDDEKVRHERYEKALEAVVEILHKGLFVYSPIVHNHYVAESKDLGREFKYWMAFDFTMLSRCSDFYILQIDGWEKSVGVLEEYKFARDLKLSTYFYSEKEARGFTVTGDSIENGKIFYYDR